MAVAVTPVMEGAMVVIVRAKGGWFGKVVHSGWSCGRYHNLGNVVNEFKRLASKKGVIITRYLTRADARGERRL